MSLSCWTQSEDKVMQRVLSGGQALPIFPLRVVLCVGDISHLSFVVDNVTVYVQYVSLWVCQWRCCGQVSWYTRVFSKSLFFHEHEMKSTFLKVQLKCYRGGTKTWEVVGWPPVCRILWRYFLLLQGLVVFSEKPLQCKMFSSEKIPRCLRRHINLPSLMCYCRVTVMASSAGVFRSALLEQIMESDNIHRAV